MKPTACLLLFIVFLLFFGPANAGGNEFYLPSPDGGCFEVENDSKAVASASADFINRRKEYRVMPVNDQLYIFNQCNERKAYCYRIPVVCGKTQRFDLWVWRAKK